MDIRTQWPGPQSWTEVLATKGFCTFKRGASRPVLREMVMTLQLTRLKQSMIRPTTQATARPNTLSSRFGLHEFPLHTDGAQEQVPPRYLILFAPRPRSVTTVVWDSQKIAHGDRTQAIFLTGDAGRRRYVRFAERTSEQEVVRYNAVIDIPQNEAARLVQTVVAAGTCAAQIDWNVEAVSIVDNWRMLHGRGRFIGGPNGFLRRIMGWTNV